jgi:hypothetical protein
VKESNDDDDDVDERKAFSKSLTISDVELKWKKKSGFKYF